MIVEVEIAKNLNPPLTKQQRNVLMRLLYDTGLPLEELAKVGRRVIDRNTYNTLAFNHWKDEMDFSGVNLKGSENGPDWLCNECGKVHNYANVSSCPALQVNAKQDPPPTN
jgi:hypothetical protein